MAFTSDDSWFDNPARREYFADRPTRKFQWNPEYMGRRDAWIQPLENLIPEANPRGLFNKSPAPSVESLRAEVAAGKKTKAQAEEEREATLLLDPQGSPRPQGYTFHLFPESTPDSYESSDETDPQEPPKLDVFADVTPKLRRHSEPQGQTLIPRGHQTKLRFGETEGFHDSPDGDHNRLPAVLVKKYFKDENFLENNRIRQPLFDQAIMTAFQDLNVMIQSYSAKYMYGMTQQDVYSFHPPAFPIQHKSLVREINRILNCRAGFDKFFTTSNGRRHLVAALVGRLVVEVILKDCLFGASETQYRELINKEMQYPDKNIDELKPFLATTASSWFSRGQKPPNFFVAAQHVATEIHYLLKPLRMLSDKTPFASVSRTKEAFNHLSAITLYAAQLNFILSTSSKAIRYSYPRTFTRYSPDAMYAVNGADEFARVEEAHQRRKAIGFYGLFNRGIGDPIVQLVLFPGVRTPVHADNDPRYHLPRVAYLHPVVTIIHGHRDLLLARPRLGFETDNERPMAEIQAHIETNLRRNEPHNLRRDQEPERSQTHIGRGYEGSNRTPSSYQPPPPPFVGSNYNNNNNDTRLWNNNSSVQYAGGGRRPYPTAYKIHYRSFWDEPLSGKMDRIARPIVYFLELIWHLALHPSELVRAVMALIMWLWTDVLFTKTGAVSVILAPLVLQGLRDYAGIDVGGALSRLLMNSGSSSSSSSSSLWEWRRWA